jgi:hypothetical protein
MRAVGKLGLDCIQAWGEAFSTEERRHVYNFLAVYESLRDKHHMIFPRPPFDPQRVPIIMAHFKSEERDFQLQEGRYDGRGEAKADTGPVAPAAPTHEDLIELDLMNQEPPVGEDSPPQQQFPTAEPPTWFTEPAADQGQLVLAQVGAMHGAQPPMQYDQYGGVMQPYNSAGHDIVPYQYPTFEQMRQQEQLQRQQQFLEQQKLQYQQFLQQQTGWQQGYNNMGFSPSPQQPQQPPGHPAYSQNVFSPTGPAAAQYASEDKVSRVAMHQLYLLC